MSVDELSDKCRKQAIDVFNYLAELARLRAKLIRDVDLYDRVYWFDSLPHETGCHTLAWGQGDEQVDDVWLEIRSRLEPRCPECPKACADWVEPKLLLDSSGEPDLRLRILREHPPASETDDVQQAFSTEPEYDHLEDHPEIRDAWNGYVERRWHPWAEEHRKWEVVQKNYAELFTIHQGLQRVGEQYELVLGLGLLSWKTGSDAPVRRHVLTAQAALEFDAAQGVFRVTAGAEGAQLRLELDMLQPGERPSGEQQRSIEEALKPAAETPWDRATIESALRAWVRSLDPRGEYDPTLSRQQDVAKAPRIHLAPALILRRRTAQTFLAAIERMIRSLQDGGPIPPEIVRLVTDPDEFDQHGGRDECEGDHRSGQFPAVTYFPLPTNDEQQQILHTLQRQRGLLVQGPPGTGKSHTIANLICHLLATGKRVLVTAQTPRALRVLQGKLPEDIRPLSVSVLGNDRAALLNLEQSVNAISGRYARWDAQRNRSEVAQLEQRLHDARTREAKLEADLRAVREKETRRHEVAAGAYKGTAQQIAHRLAQERTRFDWFTDTIPHETELPFSPAILSLLQDAFRKIDANRAAELRQRRPEHDELPHPDTLRDLVNRETTTLKETEAHQLAMTRSHFGALNNGDPSKVDSLADAVRELRVASQNIERRPLSWIQDAVYGILTDQDSPWKALRDVTAKSLEGLRDRAAVADQHSVIKPETVPDDQLLADAADLKGHFDSGKGRGFWYFRPKVVKRTQYLRSLRINGRPCDSVNTLRSLIDLLEVQKTVETLWNTWTGKANRIDGVLTVQVGEIEEHMEALDAVLAIEDKLLQAKAACHDIAGLGEPPWHDADALEELLRTHSAIKAQRTLDDIRTQLAEIEKTIADLADCTDAHPVCAELMGAVGSRDLPAYAGAYETLKQLITDARAFQQQKQRYRELKDVAPELARALASAPDDGVWDERIAQMADAWNWAQAHSWLEDYLAPDREQDLETSIKEAAEEIGTITAELAAALAWQHFFERMKEGERQHLMAWQQAIKKIGKGTGKYAAKHRRDAQEHLDKCRNAIPGWIMPLFRVLETVSPEPEMFDVVIVDEASQCGPDALFLLYLAKQIIVVGDDQQISPEAVGVNQGDVDQLIRQHLGGIEHADSFGVTSSLFDHGVIRYGGRIVLREHFRCMPEIIRFSNDLCYTAAPLIPLRQYPPLRLRPVVTYYVQKGYREGGPSRAINRPEAEAVARSIVACCRDAQYADKTMGVISLQGDAQARLIETMLLNQLEAKELEERRIICGDAYSFQGDERDVMFLSMVAAPNTRIGALTKEADKRRFNVAASRARDQMWLIHSAALEDLSQACLRHTLLRYCQNPTTQRMTREGLNIDELQLAARDNTKRHKAKPPRPFESWFELDVFLQIISRGYRVIPQERVAEYRIDLVIEGTASKLAVECDGDEFHGTERYQEDRVRQRKLERCGWHFWRVRGSEYYRDPEVAMAPLWDILRAYHIEIASDQFDEARYVDGHVPTVEWDAPLCGPTECED